MSVEPLPRVRRVVTAAAASKAEAKHCASKMAFDALPMLSSAGAASESSRVRRIKKDRYRAQNQGAAAGAHIGPSMPAAHQPPAPTQPGPT